MILLEKPRPYNREGLMSYKKFIQELEDDILPAEAERRYQEYRAEYVSTKKRAYIGSFKDEEWFKDMYLDLPGVLVSRENKCASCCREKDWRPLLQSCRTNSR